MERGQEQLYDVPRSTRDETLYINKNFDDDLPTYDTPRNALRGEEEWEEAEEEEEEEEDHIECDYDVPKVKRHNFLLKFDHRPKTIHI